MCHPRPRRRADEPSNRPRLCAGLWSDLRAVCQWEVDRLRHDVEHRRAVLAGLLPGLVAAVDGGPRSTLLWVLALALQVALLLVRWLQLTTQEAQPA